MSNVKVLISITEDYTLRINIGVKINGFDNDMETVELIKECLEFKCSWSVPDGINLQNISEMDIDSSTDVSLECFFLTVF